MAHLPHIVLIDEDRCIGCTKCIDACPVDAIVGAAKHMHTVLPDLCIGCDLCIAPCPMDCIRTTPITFSSPDIKKQRAELARHRIKARKQRLQQQHIHMEKQLTNAAINESNPPIKQQAIQAAIARSQAKRTHRY